jgi:L-lactate dehydrogenase
MAKQRIGIVGAGQVGMAGAYAMFVQEICSELVLVDVDKKRVHGEALDLMHGQGYAGRIVVRDGDYDLLRGCQVIVITAGAAQKPGETRLNLLNRNAEIFRGIAESLDRHAPDAVVIVASNPVDILTYVMQELSDRPRSKVIGTGTMLDTSRFRALLGEYYKVDPRSVHGYILGEHGDSEFAAWSTVTIGGKSPVGAGILDRTWDQAAMERLFGRVKTAAYEIIDGKGYTNWAIGLVIARLVDIILDDRCSIQPVSTRLLDDYGVSGVCLSVPTRVGMNGVEGHVHLHLDETERAALQHSATVLGGAISELSL